MFSRLHSTRSACINLLSSRLLLCMGLIDELVTGIPFVAVPLLRDRLGLSYTQVGLLFTIAALSGTLLEPLITLFSNNRSKKPWILSGLLLLTFTFSIIGNITTYLLLILTFAIAWPAVGMAVGLSQAALIDAAPGEEARTMTRWTLLSGIGDFLSPLIVAVFVTLHMGWTQLCWLAAGCWLSAALLLAPLRFPIRSVRVETEEEREEATSLWDCLREALRDPLLLRWAVLAIIPTMLDEVFLSFVTLYLRDVLHISEASIASILVVQMVASFVSLFLLDRFLKERDLHVVRLLVWLALGTLVGVLGLLFVHTLWLVIVSLFIISFSCAGWYPLAQAAAYARKPAHSGVVLTVIGLGAPFDMLLPGIIGLVSARFGVLVGLGVLGLAPILMLLLLPYRQATRVTD